ncbi:MAG: DUF1697 domain-containing protein [Deltaproteobacteria bacterium]|nr:DUF1697 domain-containing protein [Deltaproteobacteria bacterium]
MEGMGGPGTAGTACVALLRGINVGGKNIIRMEVLRASFEAMGFSSVRTLIASGNVVFRAAGADSRKLERAIEKALSHRHGYEGKVVVRNLEEYERMMRAIPPGWGGERGRRYYVIFLRHAIDRASVLGELEVNAGVEEVRYVPGALLWSARLDGLTQSKMSKVIARPIYGEMTVRNLNTTRKILELLREGAGF